MLQYLCHKINSYKLLPRASRSKMRNENLIATNNRVFYLTHLLLFKVVCSSVLFSAQHLRNYCVG